MKKLLLVMVIMAVIGWVGNNDLNDAKLEQQHYCDMVKAKAWPAYNGLSMCRETKKP